MEILKYLVLSLLCLGYFIILIFSARTKKAFRLLLLNSLLGIFVFGVLYFTKKYTGIEISLNEYTAIGSMTFGIPAVIGFLFLNLFF